MSRDRLVRIFKGLIYILITRLSPILFILKIICYSSVPPDSLVSDFLLDFIDFNLKSLDFFFAVAEKAIQGKFS